MAIIRVEKNENYTTINNTGLNDNNLSWKSKGLLAYLLSKPDDWKCQVKDLIQKGKDGRDSVYAGLKELRKNGYMIKRPIKNEKNIIVEWEEVLYETPQTEATLIYKDQEIKNEVAALKRAETIKHKKQNPLTEKPDMEKSTYGKAVNGETVNGKAVDILSTDILSTDILNTNLLVVVETINMFEENICELKKTTKEQFIKYCSLYDIEFIKAVIELCAECGTKYFAGFKTIINGYIEKDITTREMLEICVAEYREESKKIREKRKARTNKSINTSTNDKNSNNTFNDFKQRDYDFEDLKKKLLGWK